MQEFELTGDALTGVMPQLHSAATFAALPTKVRLGRKRSEKLCTAPKFADFVDLEALPIPATVDYTPKAMASLSRVYLNDQYGCCVIAGKFHNVGVWTGNDTSTCITGSDNEVLAMYRGICGPGDNGCVITQVLDVFRDTGLQIGGVMHKIDGYVSVDHTKRDLVRAAIYLFGGCTIGINFPEEWLSKAVWDVTSSRIVGGHDVSPVKCKFLGATDDGVFVSSWGRVYQMTWAAFLSPKWVEEFYAMLSPDWYNADKIAPNGFDIAGLRKALTQLGAGQVPDVAPPTPPNPTPTTWTIKTPGAVTITGTGVKPLVGVPSDPVKPCGCNDRSGVIDPAIIAKILQILSSLPPGVLLQLLAVLQQWFAPKK